MSEKTEVIDKKDIVIRFSGDSGDGMQLTGQQFSDAAALFGNGVDRKSTRLNSSHSGESRMPSSA